MSDTPSQHHSRNQAEEVPFYKEPSFWALVAVVIALAVWFFFFKKDTPPPITPAPVTIEARRLEAAKSRKEANEKGRIDVIGKHEVRAKDAANKAGQYDEEVLGLAGIADDTRNATRSLVGVIQSELQIAESGKQLADLEACRKEAGEKLEKCLKPFEESYQSNLLRDYKAREAKKEEDAAAAAKAASDKSDAVADIKKRLEAAEKDAAEAKRIASAAQASAVAKPKAARPSNTSQQSSAAQAAPAANAGQAASKDVCFKIIGSKGTFTGLGEC